jgi:hypothetical protein
LHFFQKRTVGYKGVRMSEELQGSIPPELLAFAEEKGFPRRPGETDEQYARRLMRMQGHIALTIRAASYGATLTVGMTSKEVRGAFNQRLWELLAEAGVREGAYVRYRSHGYNVQKIYETEGTKQNPVEVKVQLWRTDWDKPDNRGRIISLPAVELLKHLSTFQTD